MPKADTILQLLIENLEEGVHIVDEKGKTIYYNEAMAKLEGVNKEAVIGKKISEYLRDMNEHNSTIIKAMAKKKPIRGIVQTYKSHSKDITTINTTIPIMKNEKCIGAIEVSKDMTRVKNLNEKIFKLEASRQSKSMKFMFKDIIGNSECMRQVVNLAMRASLSNSSVLIFGETGSGKEVIAQSIHNNGIRRDKPFIAVNCAAIPSTLLESMFFGTVKGSFTGAENKKGLFEEANKGTLLLDEINSLEPYLQSKLLRVLQEGYIMPIGSNKIIDVDVRIIATLNESPEKLIEEGKLRKDFYYRLGVIRIDIPPLRDRKEDVVELSKYFIDYYNEVLKKQVIGIDSEAIDKFKEYEWPGNVRELKNLIESAMNMADDYGTLTKGYFNNKFINEEQAEKIDLGKRSLNEFIEGIEKRVIIEALEKNNYNITKTANYLKIKRQLLQYKIKKYDLYE